MFEEILNNHLRKCSDITSYLTKYDDEPAIFNQTAPDDMSDLWNDNVQYGATVKAKATDYLVFPDGRKFYVQGVDNAGSLNVSMIYYVEERFDIK